MKAIAPKAPMGATRMTMPTSFAVKGRGLRLLAAVLALGLACANPRGPSGPPAPATPIPPPVDAALELALGRAARVEGRPSQARRHLERAIQAAPSRAEARLELAELLVADGVELDRARILLQEAQLLGGDPARIARAAGALEELQGQEAQAVESYARALELSPDPDLQLRRGLLLQRLGRSGEAAAELASVLRARPGDRAARMVQAEACEAADQLAAAEHALAVASALAPADASPLRALMAFYLRHGERAKAAAVARRLGGDSQPGRKLRPLLPAHR